MDCPIRNQCCGGRDALHGWVIRLRREDGLPSRWIIEREWTAESRLGQSVLHHNASFRRTPTRRTPNQNASQRCPSPLRRFHDHLAVHHFPVSRESTQVGIPARLPWSVKVDRELFARQDDVGVGQDFFRAGDVVTQGGIRIRDQSIGQVADALESAISARTQLCGTTSGFESVNASGSPARTRNDLVTYDRLLPVSMVIARA